MRRTPGSLLLFLSLPLAAQVSLPQPKLSLDETAIVIDGVTAGGQVVFVGVAREFPQYAATIVRHEELLTDEDKDGSVRFEFKREIPHQSVWLAVDLATGRYAMSAPATFTPRQLPTSSTDLAKALTTHRLEIRGLGLAEFLWVRPGVGAWLARVGDGGDADRDGDADGKLELALDEVASLKEGPVPPVALLAKDLLFAIDLRSLSFMALEVGVER